MFQKFLFILISRLWGIRLSKFRDLRGNDFPANLLKINIRNTRKSCESLHERQYNDLIDVILVPLSMIHFELISHLFLVNWTGKIWAGRIWTGKCRNVITPLSYTFLVNAGFTSISNILESSTSRHLHERYISEPYM